MKKFLSVLLSVVMVFTTVVIMPVSSIAATPTTTVTLADKHQTMNGFGASACWWAKDVGGWENIDDVTALLYDSEKGIGLNIYRYNLGAGSDKDPLNYRNDRWAECFMNADGTYDWTRDANAQAALASAKKWAGDNMRVTLFCNSAPIYMTKNGCAIANDYWWDYNLEESRFNDFAQYGYDCVDYFQNQGYRVTDISPVNEPYGHWCRDNEYVPETDSFIYYDWANQEGSAYSRENVRDIATAFIKKFNNTDVSKRGCKITVLEANDMASDPNNEMELQKYLRALFSRGLDFAAKNGSVRDNVDTITMHSYWTSREAKQATADVLNKEYNSSRKSYKVAQTEYCQMQADTQSGVYDLVKDNMTSGLGIEYGVALANIIYDDLTILDCVEWDWWVACAYGGYTDGLVYLNKDTHEIETSKRLYTMGNFSKFTKEGSVRVGTTTNTSALKSLAFSNPDGTVSVVFINNGTSAQQTKLSVKGLNSCYSYKTYVTDKTRDLALYQNSDNTKSDTVTIPGNSVTTVVVKPCSNHSFKNVVTKATLTANGKITPTCAVCGATKAATTIAYPKTIKLSATSYTYDGKIKKPTVKVTDSKGKAIAASNYTVTYASGRKNVGKYAVKITFKGNYSGTKTLYFTIVPKGTTIASITPASKAMTVKWKKQTTQTTGYQIQYATNSSFKSAKTVTVSNAKTVSKKITKLTGKKKYYVRVRTYKKIGSTTFYSAWSKSKTVTIKK